MKSERSYLLAHGKQDAETFNVPFVTFTPGDKPSIGVYEGFFPYDPGGEAAPSSVLRTEGLLKILRQLDLEWFVPFVERMARGELVELAEVDAAYRQRSGHSMEVSPVPLRFSFMSRKERNRD